MLIAILARIIVFLGVAALAAIIVKLVIITFKKFISIIKEKLRTKIGGTVAIIEIKRVANEAIAEAHRTGNKKNLAELERMAEMEGFAMATQDANGNITSKDVEIYEGEKMDAQIYGAMDEDGILIIEA